MRLMATLAGLTPHTSHILVAMFDSLPSLFVLWQAAFVVGRLPPISRLGRR
jgi:hypothetical protein